MGDSATDDELLVTPLAFGAVNPAADCHRIHEGSDSAFGLVELVEPDCVLECVGLHDVSAMETVEKAAGLLKYLDYLHVVVKVTVTVTVTDGQVSHGEVQENAICTLISVAPRSRWGSDSA